MNENNHIVLVGLPGVGKTSIGKELSKMLKIPHLDIDLEIESEKKIKISDFIELNSMSQFRLVEKDKLRLLLDHQEPVIISSGGGTVLDLDSRILIKQKSLGVHIKCGIDEIANRINTENRPLLYNTNKKEQLSNLWIDREEIYNEVSKIKIDITGLNLKEASIKVFNKING